MPFEKTQILPSDPLLTVKFSGLLVLQPGADRTCDVGVHKFNRTHLFQAILVVSKVNQAPTLITLLTGPLQSQFLIRPVPDPGIGDFKVFEKDPFTQTLPGSDPNDARWAINLQSPGRDITLNQGAMPFVTLKTGVLFTPSLTDKALAPKFIRPPAAQMQLEHFAPELSVAIDPPKEAKVLLEWTDLGNPMGRLLPLDGDDPATTRYTVYFVNEPPSLDSEPHDELLLYYKILRKKGAPVADVEQCKLIVDKGAVRLDQMPCNPVRLDP